MRKAILTASVLFVGTVLPAQDKLNQTVSVTNDFAGMAIGADRVETPIEVPDSLSRFNLDFDYSGFETIYRGSDEFNPYLTELEMAARVPEYSTFYLKAGAGYSLHPALDLDWTFSSRSRFKAGVHASHKSYFGNYVSGLSGNVFRGYDSHSRAGLDCRADWERTSVMGEVNYEGVHADESFGLRSRRGFNSVDAMCRVLSKQRDYDIFRYDLTAAYSCGWDSGDRDGISYGPVREQSGKIDAMLGFGSGPSSFDLRLSGGLMSGNAGDGISYNAFSALVRPAYRLDGERLSLIAGLCFILNGGNEVRNTLNSRGYAEWFALWPSLKLVWKAVPDRLDIYADADMKPELDGTGKYALKYHFRMLDSENLISRTSNIEVGLRGRLWGMVHISLGAAYEEVRNACEVVPVFAPSGAVMIPALSLYRDDRVDDFCFKMALDARFGAFSLAGDVRYALYLNRDIHPVLPSPLTCDLTARYDFRSRMSVYAGADYKSAYHIRGYASDGMPVMPDYDVPYLLNLFAGAEYRIKPQTSVFVEGRNLLNRVCQYVPGISEKGIAITGGIILNF